MPLLTRDRFDRHYYGWAYCTDWEPEHEAGWVGCYRFLFQAVLGYYLHRFGWKRLADKMRGVS
jgi:hypothetical protein